MEVLLYSTKCDKKNIVGIVLGVSILPVFAVYAEGIWGYYGPQLGHSYMNRANVNGSSTGARSGIEVKTQGGEDVPTSYMGMNSWLYKDNTLVYTSGWMYNDTGAAYSMSYGSEEYDGTGYFYADGQTKAYNGNGYYTYSVFSSPTVQVP